MSLEFLILLFQDKRIEKNILRMLYKTKRNQTIRLIKDWILQTKNSAGELKSTAERSQHDSLAPLNLRFHALLF